MSLALASQAGKLSAHCPSGSTFFITPLTSSKFILSPFVPCPYLGQVVVSWAMVRAMPLWSPTFRAYSRASETTFLSSFVLGCRMMQKQSFIVFPFVGGFFIYAQYTTSRSNCKRKIKINKKNNFFANYYLAAKDYICMIPHLAYTTLRRKRTEGTWPSPLAPRPSPLPNLGKGKDF